MQTPETSKKGDTATKEASKAPGTAKGDVKYEEQDQERSKRVPARVDPKLGADHRLSKSTTATTGANSQGETATRHQSGSLPAQREENIIHLDSDEEKTNAAREQVAREELTPTEVLDDEVSLEEAPLPALPVLESDSDEEDWLRRHMPVLYKNLALGA